MLERGRSESDLHEAPAGDDDPLVDAVDEFGLRLGEDAQAAGQKQSPVAAGRTGSGPTLQNPQGGAAAYTWISKAA